jgi:hypothetical protein
MSHLFTSLYNALCRAMRRLMRSWETTLPLVTNDLVNHLLTFAMHHHTTKQFRRACELGCRRESTGPADSPSTNHHGPESIAGCGVPVAVQAMSASRGATY